MRALTRRASCLRTSRAISVRRRRWLPSVFIAGAVAAPAAAQAPAYLVRDIDAVAAAIGSDPQRCVQVGTTVFFVASTPQTGYELWKSDGTEAGTVLVKEIWPGSTGSFPDSLVDVDGTLFFTAGDGVAGRELWKSDGTKAGTVRVKDIRPGPLGSSPGGLVDANGTLFFMADDGVTGQGLWKSDGTEAGTTLVADIAPGPGSPFPAAGVTLTNANGTVFFLADDGTTGIEVWRSDGTMDGTTLVKDIAPGPGSSFPTGLV